MVSVSWTLRVLTYEWLERLVRLARCSDERSRATLAATELVRLAEAWLAVLGEHEPGEDGRCPTCPPGRWWRRRGGRCSVWATAHRYLIAPGCDAVPAPVRGMSGAPLGAGGAGVAAP